MTPPALAALERLIDSLVESGTASAVVALTGGSRQIDWWRAAGWARGGPPAGRAAELATWFDYGSLTKPFLATLALVLDRTGELPLATPLAAALGEAAAESRAAGAGSGMAGAGSRVAAAESRSGVAQGRLAADAARLAAVPLGQLLRHAARMQAWTPLYARCRSLPEVRALLLGGELAHARGGTYSDLDYILWGMAAERSLGTPLADLVRTRVGVPLGLWGAGMGPPPGDRPEVAESHMGGGREAALAARAGIALVPPPPPAPGEPQDGNARFLLRLAGTAAGFGDGAIAGHAGLFGTAAALWRLGAEWLEPGALLDRGAVAAALAGGGPFALGWWRRRHRGSGGAALSPAAFGHSGFAGGSLWIDPADRRVYVLLAHRLDSASNMNRWRRRFHAAASRALGAKGDTGSDRRDGVDRASAGGNS